MDANKIIHGDTITHRESGISYRVVTHWEGLDGEAMSFIITPVGQPDNCTEVYVSRLSEYDHAPEPDTFVRREITSRILVTANDEALISSCACTTYRVADGRESELIGSADLLTLHRCGWPNN